MPLEYAPAFLLVPFVARYAVYPAMRVIGFAAAGRTLLRLNAWAFLIFAFASLDPSNGKGRVAAAIGLLLASLLTFRLLARLKPPTPTPRLLRWITRSPRTLLTPLATRRPGRDRHPPLTVLCERRIGEPVLAACRIRIRTTNGTQICAIALTETQILWLEERPGRQQLGSVLSWRPLAGLATHTERGRVGGYRLELSWPGQCELFTGTLFPGPDADGFVGHLTAAVFARAPAR
jgi:hypothetical protein